jgi:hypothetical protein
LSSARFPGVTPKPACPASQDIFTITYPLLYNSK